MSFLTDTTVSFDVMMIAVRLIDRWTTPKAILLLLVCFSLVFGTILLTLGQLTGLSGGYGILDFDQGYDMARVKEVLGSYGPQGMRLYGRIQLLDLINPALYSAVAAVITRMLWRNRGPEWLCLMPFLGGLGDYIENVTLFFMARSFPDIPESLVSISSAFSLVKNGLMFVGLLPLLLGLAMLVARFFRRI